MDSSHFEVLFAIDVLNNVVNFKKCHVLSKFFIVRAMTSLKLIFVKVETKHWMEWSYVIFYKKVCFKVILPFI